MSNTLAPFLYQTRTLLWLARRAHLPMRSAYLYTTAPPRRRRRTTNEEIPFEIPPDLKSGDQIPYEDTITVTERRAFERIFQEIKDRRVKPVFPKQPKKPKKAPKDAKNAKNAKDTKGQKATYLGRLQRDTTSLSSVKKTGMFNINAIIEDAAVNYDNMSRDGAGAKGALRGFDPRSPLQTTYSATQREQALLRFPPSLRRYAREALGMLESGDATAQPGLTEGHLGREKKVKEKRAMERAVRMDTLRKAERARIKEMMESAETDVELWEIINKEVFTLVGQLGITEENMNLALDAKQLQQAEKITRRKRGRPRKVVVEEPVVSTDDTQVQVSTDEGQVSTDEGQGSTDQVQVSTDEGQGSTDQVQVSTDEAQGQVRPAPSLDMETYAPLYPILLLDGLELLDTKFYRSSPYVFCLLPRIKQLGLMSYVLGVSTSFYNRLIKVMWGRYDDAIGVLNVFEEMRHSGVQFDVTSRSVVSRMEDSLTKARTGKGGFFVQKLLEMPEYKPLLLARIHHWASYIDRARQGQ